MNLNIDTLGPSSPHNTTETSPQPVKYICKYEDCQKVFKAKKSLVDHTRIHKGEKPYICSFNPCDKAFTQYSSLQKHERIHKGEKPYICSSCGQSFTQVSNLKRHERSHNGERPHLCNVCSKSFTTSSNLKQHLQTHLQKDIRDKYECHNCGKTYNYNSSLKKHLQEHEEEQTKKETNNTPDMSIFDTSSIRRIDKPHMPINLPNLTPMVDPISLNPERNWNNIYDFAFPTFPQNDLGIFKGLQRNIIFSELLQNTLFGRGNNDNLSQKRPTEIERIPSEKADNKYAKRAYKPHSHHHHHVHSLNCEHLMILHDGHIDYLHDGKLHHVTDNGCLEEHELELSEQNPMTCKPVCEGEVPELVSSQTNTCCGHKNNSCNSTENAGFEKHQHLRTDILPLKDFPIFDLPNTYLQTLDNSMPNCKEDPFVEKHVHSDLCEHPKIIHNGHIDYIVEGQLHHIHDDHCDNHGSVYIVDKFQEMQKMNQFTGNMDHIISGY